MIMMIDADGLRGAAADNDDGGLTANSQFWGGNC